MIGSFLVIVVLTTIIHASIGIKPEVRIEGNPYILAIYDLHQRTDTEGNCLHQSRRAMDALMSLQWSNEMLNQNTPSNIGLVVYDSCGSLKRTLKILGQHIPTDSCNIATDVVAVTTLTTREIDTAVSNMIIPFGMIHTAVSPDTYISSSSGLSLSIAGDSMWKSQAALHFLEEFQMEYVSVFAVNNAIAEAERNLFLEMAVSNKICAFNVLNNDVNFLMNSSFSNVTLMFVSGHDDLDELLRSLTSHSNESFLLIGDSNIEFVTTPMENNTIFLRESSPTVQGFLDYLETKFRIFNETDSIFSQYLDSLPYCQFDSTFNHTICSDAMFKYLTSRSHDRTFMSIFSAYYNIFRLIASAPTLNCTGYDFTTCQHVPSFVALNMQQTPAGFPVRMNELTGSTFIEEQVATIFSLGSSPSLEIATISNDKIAFSNEKIKMVSSKCMDFCHNCGHCYKTKMDKIQTVVGYNGDIVLTAGFPIYKDSTFGEMCSELSAEGVAMAHSFLYAIDTVKDKYPSFLQGVSLGAVIYDTCGGRTMQLSQVRTSSSCPLTFMNLTLTGKLVSNIEFNSLHQPFTTQTTSSELAHFKVSSSGLSLSSVNYDSYLEALASVLKSLNWTYVSVVYSEELKSVASVTGHIANLRNSGICIFNEITINKNNIGIVASKVANTSLKTGAVILLTSKDDTMKLIDKWQESHMSLNNVNFIVFAWNYISNLPRGAIIVRPGKIEDQSLENYLKTLSVLNNGNDKVPGLENTNKWLENYHENHYKCHVEVDDNTIFPNTCTNQSTFANNDEIDISLLSFLVDSVDATVSILDVLYKSKCQGQTGLCDEFKSYDGVGSYIDSTLHGYTFNDISFTEDGSLLIPLEVINKQASSEVKVGTISKTNKATLSSDQVFAYNSDGSAVQVQHQCAGWCSSCYQCHTSTTQTVDHYFTSGDINLVGMFQVHKEGAKVGTCGQLSLQTGSEYLTEAFLYAINTAKSRYPYLLPGIMVGSLIVDTCSDIDSAQQAVANFESCFASFPSLDRKIASPVSVPGYLLYARENIASGLKASVQRYGKYALSHSTDYTDRHTVLGKLKYSFAQSEVKAIVKFLLEMGWTHVSVISSSSFEYTSKYDLFMEDAKANSICIGTNHVVSDSSSMSLAIQTLDKSHINVVILFLSVEDILTFFGTKILQKVHIISETNIAWNDTTLRVTMPLGSIVMERKNKINTELKIHLENTENKNTNPFGNPWIQQFILERGNCQPSQGVACSLPHDIVIQSSSIVTETDIMLHAIHNRIQKICGKGQDMCKKLELEGLSLDGEDFRNINITVDQEEIILNGSVHYSGTFQISNLQASTMITIGEWRDNTLVLTKENIKAYDNGGMPLKDLPLSRCVGSCFCINFNNTTEEPKPSESNPNTEMQFFMSSAKLNRELWVFVMLSIVCGGVAASMLFVIYVIYKTCIGLLNKRYIGLGLLLLVAVMAVYFSVLPFMFTPSEVVCASRYLVPGISYSLMYATCLTKLMSLMSYKLIGLGGEISNINQFLTVAFMTAVQIAVGVQHVALKGPFLETKELPTETLYACRFDRGDFLVYLIYVMLLIVLCALYSIMVRKEKKNMGEAVFILISSWISIIVWIAWVAAMVTLKRDYVEPVICIGLIVCSTVIILIVFVPKLHKIVKLKYDVNKSGVQNGGYKIDTEFMFERPHTLPGGFRSSYNISPQKTNPKSLTTFDSSLSY